MLSSTIFFVSTRIFHSSLVKPSSMKTSICGITLNAISFAKTSGVGSSFV